MIHYTKSLIVCQPVFYIFCNKMLVAKGLLLPWYRITLHFVLP